MITYDNLNGRFGLTLVNETRVRKNARVNTLEDARAIEALCKHFMDTKDPMVVEIYSFQHLKPLPDKAPSAYTYSGYGYFYEMKRLAKLSEDEKNLIEHMAYLNRSKAMLDRDKNLHHDKDYPKLFDFMLEVLQQNRYHDLHSGNFLKDEFGDYKLIDIEGFFNYGRPLTDPGYAWLSK